MRAAILVLLVTLAAVAAIGCEKKQARDTEMTGMQAEPPDVGDVEIVEVGSDRVPPPPPPPPVPAAGETDGVEVEEVAPPVDIPETTTTQTHVVAKGDTLWSIAERYYGAGKLWTKIDRANSGKYTNHTDIPVGTVLVIPPK